MSVVLATKQNGKAAAAASDEDSMEVLKRDFEKRLADIESKLERGTSRARKNLVEGDLGDLRDDFNTMAREARRRLNDSWETGEDFVRENPMLVLGGALAVGLVIGALLGRRTRD
jgi:ElaB/YqjD/DUF883 family membrane-anchored ribosome-binding protein